MFWERVGERLAPVWHWLAEAPRPLLAVVVLLLFFSPILLPLLVGAVWQRLIAPIVRRGRGEDTYRRRRGPPILRILLVAALLAGGIEL